MVHIGASLGNVHEEGSDVGNPAKGNAVDNCVLALGIHFVETNVSEGNVNVPTRESGSVGVRLVAVAAERAVGQQIGKSPYLILQFPPSGLTLYRARVSVGSASL